MSQKGKIGWYVVACLDLLGQQDTLAKLTALPNIENQEEINAFKQQILELYTPINTLRKFSTTNIKAFLEGGIDITSLPQEKQELLKRFRSTPIFYNHFSDSLFVHVPLLDSFGNFPCTAIYGVLAAIAITFLSCLSLGTVIRGGIELGLAMEINEGEIYGPALARAHILESKVAQYPRIVIGQELLRYLKEIVGYQATTGEERAHVKLAEKSLKLITTDYDKHNVLDYLGDGIRNSIKDVSIKEMVYDAYNFIVRELEKHKEEQNSKLEVRYKLLKNYFESRLPAWEPRNII
jgi:hypothetical protein